MNSLIEPWIKAMIRIIPKIELIGPCLSSNSPWKFYCNLLITLG